MFINWFKVCGSLLFGLYYVFCSYKLFIEHEYVSSVFCFLVGLFFTVHLLPLYVKDLKEEISKREWAKKKLKAKK